MAHEPLHPFDEQAVASLAPELELTSPRRHARGRPGEVRSPMAGGGLELHDFRLYAPGDDLRQVDWNAVARTGQLVLRIRQAEVSPRVDVVLDASRSMALTPAKAARALEVAALVCEVARRQGLPVSLSVAGAAFRHVEGSSALPAMRDVAFEGRAYLLTGLRRRPTTRPCGLRVLVSDFLFEQPPEPLAEHASRGAGRLCFVQLLEASELDPEGGYGARLVDAETGEALEQLLTPAVVARYRERLLAHQRRLRDAVTRVGGDLLIASSADGLPSLVRGALAPLFDVRGPGERR